jgi:hypothetical protein
MLSNDPVWAWDHSIKHCRRVCYFYCFGGVNCMYCEGSVLKCLTVSPVFVYSLLPCLIFLVLENLFILFMIY